MPESASIESKNAIHILKTDHQLVKDLFDRFERVDDRREKNQIAAQAIEELNIHATIEEEIFYPALRRAHEDRDIMNEADEEHHVARFLIAELSAMSGGEAHYDAKFKVLAENVRHHIREEESKMMPKARALDIDFEQLGERLLLRKEELKEEGVPESDEEKMIAGAGINDTPARAATKSPKGGKTGKNASHNSNDNHKILPMTSKGKSAGKRASERS